jgi:hypothetical protein
MGTNFFTRSFPSKSSIKISSEQKISDAINIKSSVSRNGIEKETKIGLGFKPQIVSKFYGFNITAAGKIARTNQTGTHSASVEISHESAPDLTIEIGQEENDDVKYGEISYSNDRVNISAKAENSDESTNFSGSGILQFPDNVFWGFNGAMKRGEDKSTYEWNAKIQFAFPRYSTTIFFNNELSKLQLNWHQNVTDTIKFGTYFNINENLIIPEFGIACENEIDPETTIKSKLEIFEKTTKEIRLGLSYSKKLSQYNDTLVTVGADINARSFLGTTGGEHHSFGFEVKLK